MMHTELAPPSSANSAAAILFQLRPRGSDAAPFELRPGRYTLGTHPDSDLVLEAEGVAPQHCMLLVGPRRVVVKALSPLTWVNEGAVRESTCTVGDRIVVGPVEFVLEQAPTPGTGYAPLDIDEAITELRSPVKERTSTPADTGGLPQSLDQLERLLDRYFEQRPDKLNALLQPAPVKTIQVEEAEYCQAEKQRLNQQQEDFQRQANDAQVHWAEVESSMTLRDQQLSERQSALQSEEERLIRQQQIQAQLAEELAGQSQYLQEQASELQTRSQELDRQESELAAFRELASHLTLRESVLAEQAANQATQERTLQARREQLEQRDIRLREREQECADLTTALAQLQTQLSLREQHLTEREGSIAQRLAGMDVRARYCDEREAELAELQRQADMLAQREQRLDSLRQQLETEQRESAAQLAALAQRDRQLSEQCQELSRQREQDLGARRHLVGRATELDIREEALRQQLSDLQHREGLLTTSRRQLDLERDQLHAVHQSQVDRLQGQSAAMAQRESQLAEREVQFVEREQELQRGRQRLQAEQQTLVLQQTELQQTQQQLQSAREDRASVVLADLQQSLGDLQHQFQDCQQDLADRDLAVSQLQLQLHQLQLRERDLHSQLDALQSELQFHKGEQEKFESAARAEAAEVTLQNEELQSLQLQLEGQSLARQQQEVEIERLQRTCVELDHELQAAAQSSNELQEQLAATQAQLEEALISASQIAADSPPGDLQDHIVALDEERTALEAERSALESKTSAMEDERNAFIMERQALIAERREMEQLQREYEQRFSELEEYERSLQDAHAELESERNRWEQQRDVEAEAGLERDLEELSRETSPGDTSTRSPLMHANYSQRSPGRDFEIQDQSDSLLLPPSAEDQSSDDEPVSDEYGSQPAPDWSQSPDQFEEEQVSLQVPPDEDDLYQDPHAAEEYFDQELDTHEHHEEFDSGNSYEHEEPEADGESSSHSSPPEPADPSRSLRMQLAEMFGLPKQTLTQSSNFEDPSDPADQDQYSEDPQAFDEPSVHTYQDEADDEEESNPQDDSVAAYMERLLARTRRSGPAPAPLNSSPPIPAPKPAATKTPAPPSTKAVLPPKADLSLSQIGDFPAPPVQQSITEDEEESPKGRKMTPGDKEVLRANLDSFRELANMSARSAVARSQSNKLLASVHLYRYLAAGAWVGAVTLLSSQYWMGGASYVVPGFVALVAALLLTGRTLMVWLELKKTQTIVPATFEHIDSDEMKGK